MRLRLTAAAAAIVLAACHGSSNDGSSTAAVARVEVRLPAEVVAVGTSLQASAVLRDVAGSVITGRVVTWQSGDAAIATVDAVGRIHAVAPGTVSISAASEGQSGVASLTVATPGVGARLSIAAGDGQRVAPGAPVPVAPEVVVTDAFGNPAPGATVTFTVGAAGGAVTTDTATSGADGHARCSGWTLGASAGAYTLVASLDASTSVTFQAVAARASPDISVSLEIIDGGVVVGGGPLVGSPVRMTAFVTSTYVADSVTISDGSRSVQATLSFPGAFSTAFDLSGPHPRDVVLVATARDVLGNVADDVRTVRFDARPTIQIVSPAQDALVPGKAHVKATCSDDGPQGCVGLRVALWDGSAGPSGTNAIEGDVDLHAYDGASTELTLYATDASNQTATYRLRLNVDSSVHLVPVAQVSGFVWDQIGSRTLFLDTSGEPQQDAIRVTDSSTGATDTLELVPGVTNGSPTRFGYGRLTPGGAIYVRSDGSGSGVRVWRGGTELVDPLVDYGGGPRGLWVAGDYALIPGPGLIRHDLATGTSVRVAEQTATDFDDVAPNGDVVYWSRVYPYRVYRWRDGVSTDLNPDVSAGSFIRPVTDGVNVACLRSDPTGQTLYIYTGAGVVTVPGVFTNYAVRNGWVAYATFMAEQVWRWRDGQSEQVTFFASGAALEALAPDGTIVLTSHGRRYLAVPGAALVDVSSTLGTVVYRDGDFFVIVGSSAARITP